MRIPNPDVNRDGIVNRQDLLAVVESLEANAPEVETPQVNTQGPGIGAPSARSQTVSTFTIVSLQRWIDVAKQRDNKDEIYLKGIRVLEQLLAILIQEAAGPNKNSLIVKLSKSVQSRDVDPLSVGRTRRCYANHLCIRW